MNHKNDIRCVRQDFCYHLDGLKLAQGLFLFGLRHLLSPPFCILLYHILAYMSMVYVKFICNF